MGVDSGLPDFRGDEGFWNAYPPLRHLGLSFVQKERGQAVRAMLDRLAYQEHTPQWQFGKPFDSQFPDNPVKVDLLARHPVDNVPGWPSRYPRGAPIGVALKQTL